MEIQGHRMMAFPTYCKDCRTRAGMPATRFKGVVPFQVFRRHFDHLGWDIHPHDPRKDQCPKCQEIEKARRKHHNRTVGAVALPGAPQPAYWQAGPTYQQLKELQHKFGTSREDILKQIRHHENEIRKLRSRLLSVVQ